MGEHQAIFVLRTISIITCTTISIINSTAETSNTNLISVSNAGDADVSASHVDVCCFMVVYSLKIYIIYLLMVN